MPGHDLNETASFRDLSFDEQARAIAETIDVLEESIELHLERSPSKQLTLVECLSRIARLQWHVLGNDKSNGSRPGDQAVSREEHRRRALDEMLEQITPENLHAEVDMGPPVGKEV